MYEVIDPKFNPQTPLNAEQQINFVESWLRDTCSVTKDTLHTRGGRLPEYIKGNSFPFEKPDPIYGNQIRFKAALLLIATTTSGRTLLHTIRCCKSHPTAHYGEPTRWLPRTKILLCLKTFNKPPSAYAYSRGENPCNGIGMNTKLHCNFEDSDHADYYIRENKGMTKTQFDSCTLFHELVHIYHILIGELTEVKYTSPSKHPMRY